MKNHFPLLDPLRFGAALGVAIFHQMFWSWAWVSIGVPGFERYVAADVVYPSAAPFTCTVAEPVLEVCVVSVAAWDAVL